ncbi:MAG: hypothetical protein OHK0038_16790 [Flammeovirgaceae bacterium]
MVFLVLVGSLSISSLFAQGYEFMVLGTKGANTVDGQATKVGATIKAGQTIKVESNAYLGLAHTSGKTLEIKKSGTYKVEDLVKKISENKGGIANQYAAFVIDELTGGDGVQNRYAQRAKTGSVTRAFNKLAFMMPEKSKVMDDKITIKWYFDHKDLNDDEVKSFRFVVTNMSKQTIFEQVVEGMSITLDLNDKRFAKEENLVYYCEAVGRKGIDSPEQILLKVTDNEAKEINSRLSEVEKSDLSNIVKAQIFEEKEMYANAINAYEEAIKSNDSEQFQNLYKAFLMRNNLSPESRLAENN